MQSKSTEVNFTPYQFIDQQHLPAMTAAGKSKSFYNILMGNEEYIIDAKGIIISSNLEAVSITGYEEWEVIGRHFSIFYPDGDVAIAENDLQSASLKGKRLIENYFLRKDGNTLKARVKISAIYNSLRVITGYRIVLKPVSGEASHKTQLKNLKDQYLHLFQNSVIGIFRFDPVTGRVQMINNKGREILGGGRQLAAIESLSDVFLKQEEYHGFVNRLIHEDRVSSFEFELKYGSTRWVSIDCRNFQLNGYAEGIVLDVTKRKAQEIEVNHLKNELDNFIYHASHDLRSPIASILGLVNLINMTNPGKMIGQYTKLIHERVHTLDILLKDLSAITYNNNTDLYFEPVDLASQIAEVAKEFSYQNDKVEIQFEVSVSQPITSDIIRLRTILRNLISNSIRYSNPASERSYVSVKASVVANQVLITIEDNGIGMDDAQLMMIFSMFNRSHQQLSGSGLGLYIVKSMVDKLGGILKLSSRVSVGTTATIHLPFNNNKIK